MKLKHLDFVRIGHALVFAAAILFSATVFEETVEHHMIIIYLILALWFISSLLIPGTGQKIKCEWACIRRFWGSNNSNTNR